MYELLKMIVISADEKGRGSQYKLLGPRGPEEGPGPEYFAYVYVFLGIIITCRLYELTHSDQAQVTLQTTQSF